MSATAIRHGVGNEYPMRVVEFARRCAEFNYSVNQIQIALAKQGHRPSWSTIKCWVDPEYAEERNIKRRRGGPGRSAKRVWRRRRERLEQLRGAGLSFGAIARVINLDYGLTLTAENVRGILTNRLVPPNQRALLEGRRISRGTPGGVA